jgi:hypothetical protein
MRSVSYAKRSFDSYGFFLRLFQAGRARQVVIHTVVKFLALRMMHTLHMIYNTYPSFGRRLELLSFDMVEMS